MKILVYKQIFTEYCHMGATGAGGKLIIYAVDQGFEHGPIKSFECNKDAYDPAYHFDFAIKSRMSAIAGPLGFLQVGAIKYAGHIPMILKINSANMLSTPPGKFDQAVTANIGTSVAIGMFCCWYYLLSWF